MTFRTRLFHAAAAGVVLCPFGLAVAAHVLPDPPRAVAPTPRAALAFGEYLVNLGRIDEGRPAAARFHFRNSGDRPLTILGFSPSCGCLSPRLDRPGYDAGERGSFIVVADTAGEASDREDATKEHYVDVRYDAGEGERTARMHVKFTLPARHVSIEPRTLLVYQFNDTPTTREITITDRRTPPLTVVGVECPSAAVAVAWKPAGSVADAVRATLSVTVPKPPERPTQTLVTITTDDPAQPTIYVPIAVFGTEAAKSPGVNPLKLLPRDAAR